MGLSPLIWPKLQRGGLERQEHPAPAGPLPPGGLSLGVGGMIKSFPAVIPLATLEKPFGRPRGYSFNVGNSTAVATSSEMVAGFSDFHRRIAPPKPV